LLEGLALGGVADRHRPEIGPSTPRISAVASSTSENDGSITRSVHSRVVNLRPRVAIQRGAFSPKRRSITIMSSNTAASMPPPAWT
jgi:hypothetical protein